MLPEAAGNYHATDLLQGPVPNKGGTIDTYDLLPTPAEEVSASSIKEKQSASVTKHYDLDALNTDIPAQRIVSALDRFFNESNTQSSDDKIGMHMLFYGMPGTGKTEFAKYLSARFSRKLLLKRCSDLESKWVGETERNIAGAFREAEETGSILFIDEADSFFTDRNSSWRSWEISRTNELLTQMDTFHGVFICCTNLKKLLDDAAIRRFTFKMEFKPLSKEKRVRLVEEFFADRNPFPDEMKCRIASLDLLTPGDIRTVQNFFRYEPEHSLEDIVHELEKEVQHKRKDSMPVIGF